ncbi:MAG TPA: bifunctional [glutamine synthetase] adenylyltransferase/[glutamine synthetase]-adenylyl-L-tyrosine phosphorylase [Acidimicrobiales bacterium]|nr:bifunctional [glutamine synthetase] adenylyltransferase/[glutamine synthetase]-adenylyl-L-tyrosine phosphorylase [Acidimicrobiales bacterium]
MNWPAIVAEVERSADPAAAGAAVDRLTSVRAEAGELLAGDAGLTHTLVTVVAASPYLGRVCATDPVALDVLAHLDMRVPLADHQGSPAALARWKRLETLRIAARDLLGVDALEAVGAALAGLAGDVLATAVVLGAGPGAETADLAVIGMGKLGGRELNYASDIDILLVGPSQPDTAAGDPRAVLDVARQCWRVDLDLRPEGRSGPLVRSLESYEAYWDRWADTWEFQALLKARAVAGDAKLGARFEDAAAQRVWGRPFGAEELRQVRAMKARAEGEVARAGLTERELKLGRGGIRDIEFAVQLLQLVHGRADPALRSPTTLAALGALAAGGYVTGDDADALAGAYRFLRTVEHRLQLWEDQQVHALPADAAARTRLARVLGFRGTAAATAAAAFDERLRRHQATVRSIHERLFFRPLLEAFTGPGVDGAPAAAAPGLSPEAVAERLAAFGFTDAERTRQAVHELTRGLSRGSALMSHLLPLLLEWLSHAADPDLGLLGLRSLATGDHRRGRLISVFRESPEGARQLCTLLGTGPLLVRELERHPDSLAGLADGHTLVARTRADLEERAGRALAWRSGPGARWEGLRYWKSGEVLRVAARDVLGLDRVDGTGRALTDVAAAVLTQAVMAADPQVPFAVIGMGRLGGAEMAYASDLDVLFVFQGGESEAAAAGPAAAAAARAGEAAAASLLRHVNGATPAVRLYSLDVGLRPEGRQGPVARSVDAYANYYRRWAQVWERQALLRGRFVAGDPAVGERFAAVADEFVWGTPFSAEAEREIRRMKARIERERIPAGEDPQFHLKLGRGSLSDVEWTAQLLQLGHGIKATGTVEALGALAGAGVLDPGDADVLIDAYRFCEATRNRLYLVRGMPGDALPATGRHLSVLARSLNESPSGLRDEYRRLTRRARRVVERVFYGDPDRKDQGARH